MATPQTFDPGARLINGDELNNRVAQPQWATNPGITALAGGGRSAATPIMQLGSNQVSTVASGADSVVLPVAPVGAVVVVRNSGANALQVFASGSDTINGTAGSTGVSLATSKTAMYIAVNNVAGVTTWVHLLSA